jgi:monoamine oxidase
VSGITRRDAVRLAAAAAIASRLPVAGAWGAPSVRAYDDGNTAVPGGIEGDPERVIVVGAGWAGLTLANALRTAGVDHVVLEARNRIGGRAHTVDLAGIPIDAGCSWIHGPIGNPMSAWAEQNGVGVRNGDVELDYPIVRYFDGVIGGEVGPADKAIPIGRFLHFTGVAAPELAAEHGPGLSVEAGWDLYAESESLDPTTRRRAGFVARGFTEMTYGVSWSRLSLAGWTGAAAENPYSGVGEGNFPVGGYRSLYRPMAGDAEVLFRHPVRAIERRRGGVVVHARHKGRPVTVRGSHVVVTVPLGVLRGGGITFEPGLPPRKRAAIAGIGFGAVEKVLLVFDEPFWSDPTHTHILHQARSGALDFPWWIDMQRTHGVPALIAFNGGPFANRLHRMRGRERKDLALRRLATILGRKIPAPTAWRATDWQGRTFSQGSYSSILTGRTPDDMDALAEPLAGRILFAGEATNRLRHSTADGAFSTGVREAKRLLRARSVQLSAS